MYYVSGQWPPGRLVYGALLRNEQGSLSLFLLCPIVFECQDIIYSLRTEYIESIHGNIVFGHVTLAAACNGHQGNRKQAFLDNR